MLLNFWEISENDGLSVESEAQQLSIRDFHSGSHHVGICGRRLLFTIPPTNCKRGIKLNQIKKEEDTSQVNTRGVWLAGINVDIIYYTTN